MTVGDIFRYIRKKKGLSLQAVCDGVDGEIVFSQLSKTELNKQYSSFPFVCLVANFLQIPIELLDGRIRDVEHLEAALFLSKSQGNAIPLLNWNELIKNPTKPTSSSAEPQFVYSTKHIGERAFAIDVVGHEMESFSGGISFPASTRLFVDPDVTAKDGDYVIAFTGGNVTFKQLKTSDLGQVLRPLNHQYPILSMQKNDFLMGVVTATSTILI